jgi:hypothetical protein
MMYDGQFENLLQEREADCASERSRSDIPYVVDLIRVLHTQPAGLRRWSVMRAIRKNREVSNRPIPQKFEDEVERAFRKFCADADPARNGGRPQETALFFKPKEKAGEVWAILADNAEAWLKGERTDLRQNSDAPANLDQHVPPAASSKFGMTG